MRELESLRMQLNFASQDEDRGKKGELNMKDIFQYFQGREEFFDMSVVKKLKDAEQAYQILEQQCMTIDPEAAQYISENPLIQLLKSGIIYKRSEGALRRWQERYMMLTNCGLLYFKSNSLQPQKFKLLNNFIVYPLNAKEEQK